jgi:hypothetical protein
MTKKEFLKRIANNKKDLLGDFVNILKKGKIPFCVIGGLAVNAYAEPVISLDLDVVIVIEKIEELIAIIKDKYKVKKYPNSINVTSSWSDLRIQIQTDERYQSFIHRSHNKNVLGYFLPVASVEDVLQGKIWAAQDEERRPSKRQKDLADILRLIETKPDLVSSVPMALKRKLSL